MALTVRRILLAADLSHPAKAAASHAVLLAEHFDAELRLMHVLSYPLAVPGAPEYGLGLGEWFTGRADQDELALQSFFAEQFGSRHVDYIVLEGDPAKRIVEYAASSDVDLIVMPAYGQGPFKRFLLGSVTARVLNDVECPVWTGIHREDVPCCDSLNIRSVICATALDSEAVKLIGWASDAARSFQARLFVVHVIPRNEHASADDVHTNNPGAPITEAREHLESLAAQVGTDAELLVTEGEVHEGVCREAERVNADLLIIGRSPQSAMFGRLPTIAYSIVRDSHCPVVSVQAGLQSAANLSS
jgi:nucleotide-binding universal stress UspA family protein